MALKAEEIQQKLQAGLNKTTTRDIAFKYRFMCDLLMCAHGEIRKTQMERENTDTLTQ